MISAVTILWSMVAGTCLTLAFLHGLIWWRRREARGSLLFALTAVSTALLGACELWMMGARDTAEFTTAARWIHVPVWGLVLAITGFVSVYLKAGKPWLAWIVCGVRTLSLVLNFSVGIGLNYRQITEVRQIPFLGGEVSVASGIANPLMIIGQFSLVLLVVFTVDATMTVWRRGERRQALVLGGSIVFLTLMSTVQAILSFWSIIPMPITASLFYMGMVAVMGFELSQDALRTARLSEELGESEQRMTLAAESANLGIWIRDFARNEIWASRQWRDLFGFAPAERLELEAILGRVHPADRETVRQTMAEAIAIGGRYDVEFRLLLPEGGIRWIASHGRVESDAKGRPLLLRGASLDCTSRKQAEQETQHLRQEIAHVGRVSMMGQLASALAHEINQPLGAILRNAEAAELYMQHDSPDLDEIRAILEDIRRDDQRAGTVIERMRSLLKRHALTTRPLAVGELLSEVASLVQGDAAARRVRLEVGAPAPLPLVLGDRVHLQQVLLNLIINAMDAVHGGSKDAEQSFVRVAARLAHAGMIEIEVSDSGHGIPAETIVNIFDPFFTTKPSGMGMGLPISQNIIETHGGKLWAENNEGGGATFRFTLPVAEGGAVA